MANLSPPGKMAVKTTTQSTIGTV